MLLLHTSDWHLGRSLHRADLRDAQAAFLDHLVATVRAERVDAVLVSGDVYDRALPPVEAVALCEDALWRLRGAGARVVVISGNHDSARRLGFGSRLVDSSGVHLRTRVAGVAEPVPLADAHGEVAVYAIPYLEPAAAAGELAVLGEGGPPAGAEDAAEADADAAGRPGAAPGRGHVEVLGAATAHIRAHASRRGPPGRVVVLAHGWVTGGAPSESERDITVGGTGAVPAALFDGFDYVALGHLHRPQLLAEHLRYSGSPLPYSFSEAGQVKGSWLVELGARGLARVEHVPAPPGRGLARLRGTLDELLTDARHTPAEGDFVAATLTDAARPEAAMDRLRARFPYVLVLGWEPDGAGAGAGDYRARVHGRPDLAVATDFVAHVRGAAATAGEQALLRAAFEAVRRAADGDPSLSGTPAGARPGVGPGQGSAGPALAAEVA